MPKRVCCLYRVSTGKQVDYNANHEADIPMQRKACHKFADSMSWNIVPRRYCQDLCANLFANQENEVKYCI